ncbi:hypothetical protein ACTMU2_36750 [Cupriavidus basilensis]
MPCPKGAAADDGAAVARVDRISGGQKAPPATPPHWPPRWAFAASLPRRGRAGHAGRCLAGGVQRAMFSRSQRRATAFFWLSLFLGMLLVLHGLNTWLPQIMRKNGYEPGLQSVVPWRCSGLASAAGGILLRPRGRPLRRTPDRRHGLPRRRRRAVAGLMTRNGLGRQLRARRARRYRRHLGLAGTDRLPWPTTTRTHAPATATGWALGFARIGAMADR